MPKTTNTRHEMAYKSAVLQEIKARGRPLTRQELQQVHDSTIPTTNKPRKKR